MTERLSWSLAEQRLQQLEQLALELAQAMSAVHEAVGQLARILRGPHKEGADQVMAEVHAVAVRFAP